MGPSAQAATCSEMIRSQARQDVFTGGMTTGAAAVSFTAVSLASTAAVLLPLVAAGGSFVLYRGLHGKSVAKLLEQAESCKGQKIDRFWKLFQKRYPTQSQQFTQADFCDAIHRANLTGLACSSEVVPERIDVLKWVFGKKEK
ncbi:MAG: hypothetical protein JNL01_13160 [Bdellovibrionales bacterium]|nr:hypothetical protein [Bdellovibrionales bacterium]